VNETGDVERVVEHVHDQLPSDGAQWPGGWPGEAEAALLDAVLSIGTVYGGPETGVRGAVGRWRQHREGVPLDDLDALASITPQDLAGVLDSRQRLSGGRLKAPDAQTQTLKSLFRPASPVHSWTPSEGHLRSEPVERELCDDQFVAATISNENLGAWLLRCNPKTWDLPGFMADGNDLIDDWTVVDNYRSRIMAPGQRVVFWVSGDSRLMARGIWGIGQVTSAAHDGIPGALDPDNIEYWLDMEAAAAVRNDVDLDIPLLDAPVTDVDLRAAGISDLEVQIQPRVSNPSWISKEQLARLESLLPPWPDEPEVEHEVTITKKGAGFGNPVQNKIVETAAMKVVEKDYRDTGWRVEDASQQKVGWDLTCTKRRSSMVARVEVKGVSGDKPIVLLTANEMNAAASADGWVLAVVTRALSGPRVTEFKPDQVLGAASPYIFKADLT